MMRWNCRLRKVYEALWANELMGGGGGRWEGGGVVYHHPKISSCEADKKKKKRGAFRSISNATLYRCRVSLWGGSSAQSVWIINSELPSAPSCFLSGHTVNPNSNWKADVRQMWKLYLHQSTCVLSLTCNCFFLGNMDDSPASFPQTRPPERSDPAVYHFHYTPRDVHKLVNQIKKINK